LIGADNSNFRITLLGRRSIEFNSSRRYLSTGASEVVIVERYFTLCMFLNGKILLSCAVGLVPRGMVHLQKVASRGLVTQGRRRTRRGMRYAHNNDEPEPELEQLWQDFSRHMNPNLTYEELVELEDSIGRGDFNIPDNVISANLVFVCMKVNVFP
jgi:hypothetical protein